jgi:hypothetical protein
LITKWSFSRAKIFIVLCILAGGSVILFLSGASLINGAKIHPITPTKTQPANPPRQSSQTSTPKIVPPPILYRPITWMQLVSFIELDHTNWNTYTSKYKCLDFAIDLVANSAQQNIKAWVVVVYFLNQPVGHAFTAFDTTDVGTVYIEPQTDIPYLHPRVGQPLCNGWTGKSCMGIISEIDTFQCKHTGYCTRYVP